jgi:uncharacterized protein (TIGR00725 family)
MYLRQKPIIGVFGSNAPKTSIENKLAWAIGTEIMKRGAILLTGSNGNLSKKDKVKDVAAAGAAASVLKGAEGAWIGVDPETKGDTAAFSTGDRCCIIGTKLGNKRNYLEAALCDVAIAFKGKEGTTSEVTFCLALNKSVVLIGDWQEFPLHGNNKAKTIGELLNQTYKRVQLNSPPYDLNKLLDRTTIKTALENSSMVHARNQFPDEEDVDSFAQTMVDLAVSYFNQPIGAFPDALTGHDEVKQHYQDWLSSLD